MPLISLLVSTMVLSAEPLTQSERDRALSHMHATRKQFLDSLAGVSEAQWKWKPSPEVWSIAEVAEHIALSEDMIFGGIQKMTKAPEAPAEKLVGLKGKEEKMLAMMVDRSRKAQAPETLKPVNKWKTKEELIAHFRNSRDRNLAYVRNTTDELRSRVMPHPVFGDLDLYQWLFLISGHSERHILQLNEVKTMAGYPQN